MDPVARDQALRSLFKQARTHNGWSDEPVAAQTLRELYEVACLAPTSMNCQPMRVVFLTTQEAKERLIPALSPGNVNKTRVAPVTAIIAYDSRFYDWMHKVWHNPAARDIYAGNAALASTTALRNSSIQGGFFILAARALGLDCGPMSGFNHEKVDAEFFKDSTWRSNFLCSLGHGDVSKLMARQARLEFGEACQVL